MGAVSFGDVGQLEERRATGTSGHSGQADEEPPILLPVHSDVVTRRGGDCRGGTVDQFSLQTLGLQAPTRWASIGFVERPPPTQRSKPGPYSGCSTPTKATSFTSGATSWSGTPVSAVLNLRGRLANCGSPM